MNKSITINLSNLHVRIRDKNEKEQKRITTIIAGDEKALVEALGDKQAAGIISGFWDKDKIAAINAEIETKEKELIERSEKKMKRRKKQEKKAYQAMVSDIAAEVIKKLENKKG